MQPGHRFSLRHFFSARWLPALLLSLLLPMQATAEFVMEEYDDWRSVREGRERGDVTTHARSVEESPVNMFRGVVEVPHPLVTVMAVISDVASFDDWVFNCHGTEMRDEEWGREYARIMISGIWPVRDRDVVVRSYYEQDPDTLAVTVFSRAVQGIAAEHEDYVRVPALNNIFRFEPLDDGWTRVTFQTFVDPGGRVPVWLSNLVSTRAPLQTLQGMKAQMDKAAYQLNSPDELPAVLPGAPDLTFPENHQRSVLL